MRHPEIPPELRGTYAGLGHEAAIAHLIDLGVTTVELLPVHESGSAPSLVARDFWRSQHVVLGEFATRFRGSPDLAAGSRRTAPVNLMTVHDGFTLRDLVSYNDKHNEANGKRTTTGPAITGPGTAGRRARPLTPPSLS